MRRKKTVGESIADELKQFLRDVKRGKAFMVLGYDPKTGKVVRRKMTMDEILNEKRLSQPNGGE